MKALIERLQQLETAVVADVLSKMGLRNQILAPGLMAVTPGTRLAGHILTCEGDEKADSAAIPNTAIDAAVTPGCVVFMATDGCRKGAVLGDNMATAMLVRGARGFIVLGGIRDTSAFRERNIPVFHEFACPQNAFAHWSLKAVAEPLVVSGVEGSVHIAQGDYVLADDDGIVILPQAHAEQVVADSEIHLRAENAMQMRLATGADRKTVTADANRLAHVRPLAK